MHAGAYAQRIWFLVGNGPPPGKPINRSRRSRLGVNRALKAAIGSAARR